MANTQVEDLPGMATRPAVQMPRIFDSLVVKPRVSVWNENRAATTVHNLPAMQETQVQSLGWEDHLEEEVATRFSIFVWEISWTEEPGGL